MATPSRKSTSRQRAFTRAKIRKLQRAGLLSSKINANARPSNYVKAAFYKYGKVISGKQAAVKVSDAKRAKALRQRIGEGGHGKIVIVSREKGEKFKIDKKGDITSTRRAYGQTITKTIGDKFTAPLAGEKIYYTLPRRKRGLGSLKRRTFASFDELLFYLQKYEIDFEDIEDYIEVEKFKAGSATQKRVQREYNAASRKLKNKRKVKSRRSRRK